MTEFSESNSFASASLRKYSMIYLYIYFFVVVVVWLFLGGGRGQTFIGSALAQYNIN